MGADMAVGRNLAQGAVELLLAQVQGVVINLLAGRFDGVEEKPNLSQIPDDVSATKRTRSDGKRGGTKKMGWDECRYVCRCVR